MDPCNSTALLLLGNTQMTLSENEAVAAKAMQLLKEARRSYQASIFMEGKKAAGKPPEDLVRKNLSWCLSVKLKKLLTAQSHKEGLIGKVLLCFGCRFIYLCVCVYGCVCACVTLCVCVSTCPVCICVCACACVHSCVSMCACLPCAWVYVCLCVCLWLSKLHMFCRIYSKGNIV